MVEPTFLTIAGSAVPQLTATDVCYDPLLTTKLDETNLFALSILFTIHDGRL